MRFVIKEGYNPMYWINLIVPSDQKVKEVKITDFHNNSNFEYKLMFSLLDEIKGIKIEELKSKILVFIVSAITVNYSISIQFESFKIELIDDVLILGNYNQDILKILETEFWEHLMKI